MSVVEVYGGGVVCTSKDRSPFSDSWTAAHLETGRGHLYFSIAAFAAARLERHDQRRQASSDMVFIFSEDLAFAREKVWDVIRGELIPWALGSADPVRERVAKRRGEVEVDHRPAE